MHPPPKRPGSKDPHPGDELVQVSKSHMPLTTSRNLSPAAHVRALAPRVLKHEEEQCPRDPWLRRNIPATTAKCDALGSVLGLRFA